MKFTVTTTEALSSAGRNVIKRIAPFYVWSKTNIPFQIKNIINQTGKYSALGRLQEQIMPLEERKKLPDYLQEKFLLGGKNLPSGDKSIRMASYLLRLTRLNKFKTSPTGKLAILMIYHH